MLALHCIRKSKELWQFSHLKDRQDLFPNKKCCKADYAACKDRLPPKVVHQRLSSTIGRLPPKVSSTEGGLPLKVVFHQRSSSTKGHLPPKVVFQQRSSSTGGNLLRIVPPKKKGDFLKFCFYSTLKVSNITVMVL